MASTPLAVASECNVAADLLDAFNIRNANCSDANCPCFAYACHAPLVSLCSCWGSDFSGLGLLGAAAPATLDWFSRRYSLEPLPLAEPGPWNLISSGDGFSCAVKSEDSSAWCWVSLGLWHGSGPAKFCRQ